MAHHPPPPTLEHRFDVQLTVAHILRRGATRVALQFPDELLAFAPAVTSLLFLRLAAAGHVARLNVLGDTSYGACCVDEVAARHEPCDLIVHYGHACLSAPSTLPVYFVFDKLPLHTHACAASLLGTLQAAAAQNNAPNVLLLWDTEFTHAVRQLMADVQRLMRHPSGDVADVERAAETAAAPDGNVDGSQTGDKRDDDTWEFGASPHPRLLLPTVTRALQPVASLGEYPVASGACGSDSSCACRSAPATAKSPTSVADDTYDAAAGADATPATLCASQAASRRGGAPLAISICGFSVHPTPTDPSALVLSDTGAAPDADDAPGGCATAWAQLGIGAVFFVGSRSSRLRSIIAQSPPEVSVWQWNPRLHPAPGDLLTPRSPPDAPASATAGPGALLVSALRSSARLMAQRYRCVEAVRSAAVIGLVVGTLGVARHGAVLAQLRAAARRAGRTAYTIVVGKPNPAKLSNFPEVEAFVLISCPENELLLGRDEAAEGAGGAAGPVSVTPSADQYATPIATPFEALVALATGEEAEAGLRWSGRLELAFDALLDLAGGAADRAAGSGRAGGSGIAMSREEEEEEGAPPPMHSLLSHRLHANAGNSPSHADGTALGLAGASAAMPPTTIFDEQQQGEGAAHAGQTQLIAREQGGALALLPKGIGAGAAYLNSKRQWRGLAYDAEPGEDGVGGGEGSGGRSTEIGTGSTGVAGGYEHEG